MKNILLIAFVAICMIACRKDDQNFKLKTITINSYTKKEFPAQRLYVRVIDAVDTQRLIGKSESYPSNLPLPVTLAVPSSQKQTLYKNTCYVQLWGDSTGMISSAKMNMDLYKISFPLSMNVSNKDMDITLSGSWE
ncbi:hypothetical protein [Mucilaginibacter aquaedulcis]|uniref:hypothetical protein n=1 Tax=Mucilaginibacter aquaedulcis TaxID=1187081 RepID=UPI0025B3547F|nr:hypothetical protein [Mucilaginibacter aquaedulcis]MDN3551547.1 hypothetical protein [Mucilaginibacter aquaedulcis]